MTAINHEFGYIQDGKVFRKGFLEFPDRQIGEVKQDEETTIKYFEDRYAIASGKVEQLEKQVTEAENKGSYLMKLIHMRDYLVNFDALGDFVVLFEKLDKIEEELRAIINVNRQKNLEIKRALLEEAKEYAEIQDLREAGEKYKDLKMRWIKTGSVEDEYKEEVEDRFHEIVQGFYDRRQAYFDHRQKMMDRKIDQYRELVDRTESLKRELDPRKAVDESRRLQQQWRRLDRIPASVRNELWATFKRNNDYIYRRFKQQGERRGPGGAPNRRQGGQGNYQNREQNLMAKKELLERAKTLEDRSDRDSVEEVKRLQTTWKSIGSVPPEEGRKLAENFHIICDLVRERNFLDKLTHSRLGDTPAKKDELELKIKILQDLLSRDERELDLFQDNVNKLNSDTNSFNRMLDGKLSLQQRKVTVKRRIMDELRSELASI
ncbi:DUF349 domain-containing protein [Roseivirga sp. BDSF3-8]|uniref:DUF349 domain-containing protein n=1 Tax=Roseivirga sp. BDSF3-8 TaxID=3241598 RepID=UPI0035326F53